MSMPLRPALRLLCTALLAACARGAESSPNAAAAPPGPNRAQATAAAKVLNGFRYEILLMGATPE
ncbi:MAG: alkaline phosphatase family protein, partial [Verrucomicrobiota bacterium]